ncbi:anti-CBASS protein Acb1 family protein [Escherichia coli]|uniref:anti-CBASS protein Acb1 family protein n=1 Tax=Escherichia coli TaxID=562 RepID=UPI003855B475
MGVVKLADYRPQLEVVEHRVADTEDGFMRVANEITDSLLMADLTVRQMKVMLAIMRKTYGFNKPMDRLTNTQIAAMTGIHHTHVCAAKRQLIERKFLIADGVKIGVNKVVSQWISQDSLTLAKTANKTLAKSAIPLVRLFGQSPKGFSTGDADLANYYDRVSSLQERRLRLPVRRILDIMHRSELGKPLPDDFTFEFNPLWQMSDVDRSTVALNTTNAISTALGDGLMTLKAAMTDLRENSDVTGIGASITDEDIENAEDEAPPGIGEPDDEPQEPSGGNPVSNQSTQDSAGGRGHRKWSLRWFK